MRYHYFGIAILLAAVACDNSTDPSPTPPAPPPLATLVVDVTTDGVNLDPDGYVVQLTGGPGIGQTVEIPVQARLEFPVPLGERKLRLYGLAPNCRLSVTVERPFGAGRATRLVWEETRTILIGAATRVPQLFGITCVETGTLRIEASTTGPGAPSSYVVELSEHPLTTFVLPKNGAKVVPDLSTGRHSLIIGVRACIFCSIRLPPTCRGDAEGTIDVPSGREVAVRFEVVCD